MKRRVDILLPCLNEEHTLAERIKSIKKVAESNNKYNMSIIVCDNGSTDSSVAIAKRLGAKVVIEKNRGYGSALRKGIQSSRASLIVMLDSDLSYDAGDIPKLLDALKDCDIVIGNRFKGNIDKGAMPLFHRIGSRALTIFANLLFHTKSHDYHCGIRAFRRKAIIGCGLESTGFEFASEMIIRAKLNKLRMKEVPANLSLDGRNNKPHLKTIRDGLRHFRWILKLKFSHSHITCRLA